MKRFTAFIIIAVMLAASLLPAFAADGSGSVFHDQGAGNASQSTPVTYGVNSTFTVVIPSYIPLAQQGSTQTSVSAKDVYILSTQTLTVGISSDNEWSVVNVDEDDKSLNYTATKDGAALQNGDTVLSVGASAGATEEISFQLNGDAPVLGGTYKDELTFTVAIG